MDIYVHDAGGQAITPAAAIGARIRKRANDLGLKAADLCRLADIRPQTMSGYWNGERSVPSDKLFAIADALKCSGRWLAAGVEEPAILRSADTADWVSVPEYDLRQFDDFGKGPPLSETTFRRDWLYLTLGDSNGLWIARTLAPDFSLGLPSGAAIVCKDQPKAEPPLEGQHYLFRVDGSIMLSRFSYRSGSLGIIGDRVEERVITPTDLNAGEHQFFIVARVLGALVRPF